MIRILLVILLLFFAGCDKKTSTNKAPTANITVNTLTLHPSETVQLDARASQDSDGKITTYAWFDNNHLLFSHEPISTWTAPSSEGNYTISLRVTDDDGAIGSKSVTIAVQSSANVSPVAQIKASKTSVVTGETVTLDGRDSYDSDGNIVGYEWIDEHDVRIGTGSQVVWTAPNSSDNYRLKLKVTDNQGASSIASIMIRVDNAVQTPFSTIQNLIKNQHAIYICVGDSTRATDKYPDPYYNSGSTFHSDFLFPRVATSLDAYQTNIFLYARQGHEAKQFNLQTAHPTWQDVVDRITASGDATGASSIVNISLGINDLFSAANNYNGTVADIKQDITAAINKIRQSKPNTHFILTMPNPKDPSQADAVTQSNIVRTAYLELSSELNIPLINVMDEITFTSAVYKSDAIHFHLIASAQEQVAELIKSKILP